MKQLTMGDCTFDMLTEGERFDGLGRISIDGMAVRSGRLPLMAYSQSLMGMETADYTLKSIEQTPAKISIHLSVAFRPVPVRQALDWNLDHVLDTSDWDKPGAPGRTEVTLHITPASDSFGGVQFRGFAYSWEYSGVVPLYWILDRASWEIGGDIRGATVYSQSLYVDPSATFDGDTSWSTELTLAPDAKGNRDILQFWPRWMSLQPFDFQFNNDAVLAGVFENVGMIRSVLKRDSGSCELKTLDRHVFNESTHVQTVPKKILLAVGKRSLASQRDLWTSILDTAKSRALAEIGMKAIPPATCLQQDFWQGHTFDSYRKDLLPAAIATEVASIRLGNINRSNATQGLPGNQCESHEYVVAENLGGVPQLKALVDDAKRHGIEVYSWTSTAQSPNSPIFREKRNQPGWFVRMEDGRQVFGGTHSTDFQFLSLAHEEPRKYWIDSLKKIKDDTGVTGYFWDMATNVSYIPVDYLDMQPRTMWRESLSAAKELQDAGITLDGLCGPFVRPGPGGNGSYSSWDNLFLSYHLLFSPQDDKTLWTPQEMYRIFAHGSVPMLNLFYNGTRIDTLFTDEHRRVMREFRTLAGMLKTRVLRDDGAAVEWPQDNGSLLICNLVDRRGEFRGGVRDLTSSIDLPRAIDHRYQLLAGHTYQVTPNSLE